MRINKKCHLPHSTFGLLIILAGLWGFLTSCGSSQMNMGLILESTNQLNQSDLGQPVPATVRIYTLKDRARFERATFQELWKNDYEFLGQDLLDRKEMTLLPSSTEPIEVTVDPEKNENFLGVIVKFRNYQDGIWRRVIPVEEPGFFSIGDPEFLLTIDRHNITEPVED